MVEAVEVEERLLLVLMGRLEPMAVVQEVVGLHQLFLVLLSLMPVVVEVEVMTERGVQEDQEGVALVVLEHRLVGTEPQELQTQAVAVAVDGKHLQRLQAEQAALA